MEYFNAILLTISQLTAEQIALISIIITLLLFVLGKFSENRLRVYETRKDEYRKLMQLFEQMFLSSKDQLANITENKEAKEMFISAGASLAIFGSKKLYKSY